jgi:hypothetical protein
MVDMDSMTAITPRLIWREVYARLGIDGRPRLRRLPGATGWVCAVRRVKHACDRRSEHPTTWACGNTPQDAWRRLMTNLSETRIPAA